jgi:hypothetical protein
MTDSIKNKIAALLAKAEGTDNEHEQDAFMAKVNELLERHQIEMHEIRKMAGLDKDPLSKMTGDIPSSHEWPTHVGFELAWFYGAELVRHKRTWKEFNAIGTKQYRKISYTYTVVGRESACVTFDMMYPFVLSQVRQQARRFAKKTGLSMAKAERSVGMALVDRINKLRYADKQRREANERNALVPVDDLKAYVDSMFTIKMIKDPDAPIYDGADEYAAGVSLNQQTDAINRKRIA